MTLRTADREPRPIPRFRVAPLLALFLGFSSPSLALDPDWVFYNGHVITVNEKFEIAQAIAIAGNKFVAVGDDATVRPLAGPGTTMVDLNGKTVIPGLNDAHTHMMLAALSAKTLNNKYKVHLLDAPDMKTALERIADEVSQRPKGAWIVTSLYRGSSFDEAETRGALDAISPDSLVYLRITGKSFLLNSYGLRKVGLTAQAPFPDGAGRDLETGELTGYFYGEAADVARQKIMERYFQENEPHAVRAKVTSGIPPMWDVWEWPAEAYYEGLKSIQKALNAVGITGVRDMGVWPEQIKAYQRLWKKDEMTVRVNMVLGLPTRYSDVDEIAAWIRNYSRIPLQAFGDHKLSLGGLKLDAGNPNFSGDKVRKVILEANRYGWRLNIHHRGVKGTTALVIESLKEANQEMPIKDRRFSLEHNMAPQAPEIYRFLAANNVIVSPNPLYDFYAYSPERVGGRVNIPWEGFDPAREKRIPEQLPFADYRRAGIVVTLGSDYPAVNYDIDHPFLGYYVAVSKQTLGGRIGDIDQRATREEALKFLTLNAAYVTHEEDVRGSIEAGKLADMVVISDDLLSIPTEEIKDVVVLQTFMDGKLVYSRESN